MIENSQTRSERSRAWLIKGVMRRGDILMIYGPSGVGKSIYMLNIVAALVEGKPVLGLWKCKQCNVGLLGLKNVGCGTNDLFHFID